MLSSSLSPWVPPKANVPEVLITYQNKELKEKCLKFPLKKRKMLPETYPYLYHVCTRPPQSDSLTECTIYCVDLCS